MFHLVSLSLRISLAEFLCLVPWLVCGCCLFVFCLCSWFVSCFQGNLISILLKIPVVDRPCLALARQCRKKKRLYGPFSELRLGLDEASQFVLCGVRSDETFCPIPPQDRSGLFKFTVRLMRFMLSTCLCLTLPMMNRNALRPLVYNSRIYGTSEPPQVVPDLMSLQPIVMICYVPNKLLLDAAASSVDV